MKNIQPKILSYSRLTNQQLILNGETLLQNKELLSNDWLSNIYKYIKMDYPKFFKMDRLSKAGILASEIAMNHLPQNSSEVKDNWAICCFNHAASLDDDLAYQKTIEPDNFYPSPSVFVYTLANIVTGEIAIKYKIKGETSFYVSEQFSPTLYIESVQNIFNDSPDIDYIMGGWVEYLENHCDVLMMIVARECDGSSLDLNEENLKKLI